MNILLVNDDGYDALGIVTLKKLLSKYGNVVIVGPDSPRSGSGAALTIGRPLQLIKVEEGVYKCNGTPVDCACMGLSCFNVEFDLVVSGCNDGLNISYDTMYSGTVGAALEALVHRKPAIAFSMPHKQGFSTLEQHFDKVWKFIMDNKLLSKEYFLNINFPHGEVKDIQIGNLYYRNDKNYYVKHEDGYYAARDMQKDFDDKESDCYQVEHGIISIVPISKNLYNPSHKEELKKKLK